MAGMPNIKKRKRKVNTGKRNKALATRGRRSARGTEANAIEIASDIHPLSESRNKSKKEAYEMFIEGRPLGYIAGLLGVSHQTVRKYISEASTSEALAVEEMRELVLARSIQRLDNLYLAGITYFQKNLAKEEPEFDHRLFDSLRHIVKAQNDIMGNGRPNTAVQVNQFYQPTMTAGGDLYKKQIKRVQGPTEDDVIDMVVDDDGTTREDPRVSGLSGFIDE